MAAHPPADARFAEFYARYHGRLLGFAVDTWGPAEADDIAQETMARALAAYARLDPERDPWPWLAAVARNIARDHQRRRRVIAWVGLDCDEVTDLVAADSPHDAAADVEQRRLLRDALGNIAPGDRDVLVLRECHNVSFEELARMSGRTTNAVRQHAFRARRRLASEFTALGGRALGAGTAVAARWVRARVGDLASPAAAQVATAALAGGLVLAGGVGIGAGGGPAGGAPGALGGTRSAGAVGGSRAEAPAGSDGAAPRGPAAQRGPVAVRGSATRGTPAGSGSGAGPGAPPPAPHPRVRMENEVGGTPGRDLHHRDRAAADAGVTDVGLAGGLDWLTDRWLPR
jgi:RNA polymerase sigma-70 factor (ECF subfamily)